MDTENFGDRQDAATLSSHGHHAFMYVKATLGGKLRKIEFVSGMGETEIYIYHMGSLGLPPSSQTAAVLVKKGSFS